jgi:hypothetical protein
VARWQKIKQQQQWGMKPTIMKDKTAGKKDTETGGQQK